ncbi:T-complex protein 1 subunit theta, partial [Teratosphaeriaceae sp. CCFEE 6253]
TNGAAANGASKSQANGGAAKDDADSHEDGEENNEDGDDEEEEEIDCTGVDMENSDHTGTLDASEEGILDLMLTKQWAIRLATEAARTVLSVDQIIVARQAGGPKPPGPNPNWDED